MAYQIPSDIQQRVQEHLCEGRYQSEDDVLRDAMDALDARENEKLSRWNERNRIAMEQSAQGLSKPLHLAALMQRVEKRVADSTADAP